MKVVCLDLEGVLVPEIWQAVAQKTKLKELNLTTRDISDYDELMNHRVQILQREKLTLKDIQNVIHTLGPLDGALEFVQTLRRKTQLVILSDTFDQFVFPLIEKLQWPTIFCNTLIIDDNRITGYKLRQQDGKRKAVQGFRSMGFRVFAAGDSHNDVSMIQTADMGMFFRSPKSIKDQYPQYKAVDTYQDFMSEIESFLLNGT